MPSPHRFPPPWSVEEPDPKLDQRCFIVRDANGQSLAYVYFELNRGDSRLPVCSRATRPIASPPMWPTYRSCCAAR